MWPKSLMVSNAGNCLTSKRTAPSLYTMRTVPETLPPYKMPVLYGTDLAGKFEEGVAFQETPQKGAE